jgi:hypothetical protein
MPSQSHVRVTKKLVVKVPDVRSAPKPRSRVNHAKPVEQRSLRVARQGTLTREEHAACVAAWMDGNHGVDSIVAQIPSLNPELARRAIKVGEPTLGLRPIRQVAEERIRETVAAEQEARAAGIVAVKAEVEEKTKSRIVDAAEHAAREVQMVRGTRALALGLQDTLGHLLRGTMGIAREMSNDMLNPANKMSVRERMGLIRNVAQIAQRTAEVGKIAVTMERLLVGDPTSIIDHRNGGVDPNAPMTEEEAQRWFDMAMRQAARGAARVAATVDEDDPDFVANPLISD